MSYEDMSGSEVKKEIFNSLEKTFGDFFYYDRKEDEDLPRGVIQQAVRVGVVTRDELVKECTRHIDEGLAE